MNGIRQINIIHSRILTFCCINQHRANSDRAALDRRINAAVYGLYNLSKEEIKVVEGEK